MRLPAALISHHDQTGPLRLPRRHFVRTQTIKGCLGLALCVLYLTLVGTPERAEAAVFVGLIAPLGLAALGRIRIRLRYLEAAALALFAALITLLSSVTGGLASPFLIWLMLVPFEGALAGRRLTVAFAGLLALLGLIALLIFHAMGMVPPSRLHDSLHMVLAFSLLVAIVQGTLIAIAAQEKHQVADNAAAAGEARYRFLAENAMDLITSHTPDGRINFASPASLALLGFMPDELAGRAIAEFTHPDERTAIDHAFDEASRNGRAASAEVRLKRKTGSYVWTELRCRPAGITESGVRGVVAVTRDITERKAHERALIEARDLAEDGSRAKSRFLANMSHELRTPLNAIIGFSEVMTHEMFGPVGAPRYLEYVRLINESGSHLLELINSILDMSKIEAGRFELSRETFDLDDVAAQALRFVKLHAERQGVILEQAIDPAAKHIFADKRAVAQILINLLSNGVKFTPNKGIVRVTAMASGHGIEIAVTDTGTGISEEDLKRVGQPFERAGSAHTRAKEGTGLGLALVRSLAKLHGGSTTIESVLGEGTTVRVRLPKAAVLPEGQNAVAVA